MKTNKGTTEIPAGKKESPMKGVKDIECPSCGNSTTSYADDLTFDADSTKIIEKYIADKPGELVHARKKRTLKDIIGLVKAGEDAVESKKRVQKGLDKVHDI